MNAAKQRRQERRSFIMMTTASEHKIDKVEKMAGGKGHVIIEHLLGEAELDGKCRPVREGNDRAGLHAGLSRAPRRDRDLLHPERRRLVQRR